MPTFQHLDKVPSCVTFSIYFANHMNNLSSPLLDCFCGSSGQMLSNTQENNKRLDDWRGEIRKGPAMFQD